MFARVFILLLAALACVSAFTGSPMRRMAMRSLNMIEGGQRTSPGANLKPMFDGTFKEAGAHLEKYVLEHENGCKAIVDTKTATCISWKDPNGVECIDGKAGTAHFVNGQALGGEFVPEERAKKISFDRMIFKNTDAISGMEYRVDVTMRENTLEYDVVIKNFTPNPIPLEMQLKPHVSAEAAGKGAAITKMTGYTEKIEGGVATKKWEAPVGKFKETAFYAKIDCTKK